MERCRCQGLDEDQAFWAQHRASLRHQAYFVLWSVQPELLHLGRERQWVGLYWANHRCGHQICSGAQAYPLPRLSPQLLRPRGLVGQKGSQLLCIIEPRLHLEGHQIRLQRNLGQRCRYSMEPPQRRAKR